MSASQLAGRPLALALSFLFAHLPSEPTSRAETFELQAFRPALDSKGMVTLDRSQVLEHMEPSFGLISSWAAGILHLESEGRTYDLEHVISPSLVAALGLRPLGLDLQVGLALPFRVVSGDRGPNSSGSDPDDPNDDQNFSFASQGVGSADLQLKWRLLDASRWPVGLALVSGLSLPSASPDQRWLGDPRFTPHARLAIDQRIGALGAALNVGVRLPGNSLTFIDQSLSPDRGAAVPTTGARLQSGPHVPYGLGLSYELTPQKVELIAEVFGQRSLGASHVQPMEALLASKLHLARNSYLSLGAGTALTRGRPGAPSWRAFVGIVFEPRPSDRDRDGIDDDKDRCPDRPEDRDDFQDSDGCPDLDNDRDGILDIDDRCPDDAEDVDGFDDGDGCPDPDNDGDRILDEDDDCPGRDGEALDEVMEIYNTVEDDDGCPDRGSVSHSETGIEVLEEVHFRYDSDEILPSSFAILRAVALTIQTHADIGIIEVQGHTDDRGSRAYNLDLSQRRASSVARFLRSQGVDGSRLRARGYGEDQPREPGTSESARAANRRVEFVIVR